MALTVGAGVQGRDYNPLRFTADPVVSGSHVILIDDSWTTGANVQSAATTLKRAGAAQVSALILGRLLNDAWEPTRQFIDYGGLRSPFDPNACPWAGASSHSA
ncbi:MAG: phosphoribosyltransferase [Micropruina sp.]|uniref:ComF family protein n=1 Tax=Micropruina sp. TaxID=2737536 RepID=UPI0039E4B468